MATKPQSKKVNRSAVNVLLRERGENPDDATARVITRPEVQAAALIEKWEGDTHDVNSVVRELERQVAAVQGGDLTRAEAMLVAQAHSLDELFSNLARRANTNIVAGYRDAGEIYLRLAFKAQAQCRTTWETLAEIKNPRSVAFVRQANISNGPQQVNNGVAPESSPARAEKSVNPSNELLEHIHGERLDTRAAGKAGTANSGLATVGAIDRPNNRVGESPRIAERL